jgi:hypothetical protein
MKKELIKELVEKAKNFSSELTNHSVVEKDLKGEPSSLQERVDNNLAVQKLLIERGVNVRTMIDN